MKPISIFVVWFVALAFANAFALFSDEKNQPHPEKTKTDSVQTQKPEIKETDQEVVPANLGLVSKVLFFDALSTKLKYDTSPQNPEHRCYDIRKPLSRNYTFVFNFLSKQKYIINPH